MPAGEIFLGAFITVLFEKLASNLLLRFASLKGIDTLLKKWSKKLSIIHAVLHDAEERQNSVSSVKEWLNDLQNLAYDLDDVVDELGTEALRSGLMEAQANRKKVLKFIPICCNHSSLEIFMFSDRMGSKINEITNRLEGLTKQISILHLMQNDRSRPKRIAERLSTTSLVDESHIHGREMDKEEMVKLLISGTATGDQLSVIPIMGMGGVGKTTLTQLVYNDERINEFFDLKVWVCVTDDFDVCKITRTILEAITSKCCDFKDLNMLQVGVKERLSGQKFLIVLDDVWNEKYEDWDILRQPFLVGSVGSKLIMTTRHERVASTMSSFPPYHLKKLDDDDCLSLLAHHALGTSNFDAHRDLKEVSKQIVRKCDNLPLAVKTLGGLLRAKHTLNEWNDVLNSELWEIPDEKSDILPALKLSYHHLPCELKRCFAYCSLFPKDYEFDKDELVLLWMAQGFLQLANGKKTMEDQGDDYFKELLSRSFFQRSSIDDSHFVMHDLINDLAQYVAGNVCIRMDAHTDLDINPEVLLNSRHSSYTRQTYEVFQKFRSISGARHLRTFLPLPIHKLHGQGDFLSNRILYGLLPRLKCLRTLSLSNYSIDELPNSVGNLKHLRYLNLTGTSIKRLPESVSDLCNLQTLSLRNCWKLITLPRGLNNLVNLRHLDNANTDQLHEMPPGIGGLTNLQTLSKVTVSKNGGLNLKELESLSHLKGEVSVVELQNVLDAHDAREANLRSKIDIDSLKFVWSDDFDDSRDAKFEFEVLDALFSNSHLKSLEIESYGGDTFPSWIADPSFSNLLRVSLSSCKNCIMLPPLGQLRMLKNLTIRGMHQVKEIGIDFYGSNCNLESPFPLLETLSFEDMPQWEKWSCVNTRNEFASNFPSLHELCLHRCPKLVELQPLQLPHLCQLELEECWGGIMKYFFDLTSLINFQLRKITGLQSLQETFVRFPLGLEVVEIYQCDDLVSLWPSGKVAQNLLHLHTLVIEKCPKLVFFRDIGLLPSLKSLHIYKCEALDSIPNSISRLEMLRIWSCPSLKSIPKVMSRIEHLTLDDCSSLMSLPTDKLSSTLKELEIGSCMNLELFSHRILEESSTSLEHLDFNNWPNLNIERLFGSCQSFISLTRLNISFCGTLQCFPEGGLPTPKLRHLYIRSCESLNSLPHNMDSLTSLEFLWLHDCPSLDFFPHGEFPPKLTALGIRNCGRLKPLVEWNLSRLTSLQSFYIEGGYPELTSFSNDKGYLLPASLISIGIGRLPNLQFLANVLEKLISLRKLSIWCCPKLESLPLEDLFDRLWSLEIRDCVLLKRWLVKDRGDYWSLARDIPCVRIYSSSIQLGP